MSVENFPAGQVMTVAYPDFTVHLTLRSTSELTFEIREGPFARTETVRIEVTSLGNGDKEARDAFFPGWAHLTATVGRERGWTPPTRAQFDDMAGPGGAFLIGEPATVAAKLRRAGDALGGLSRVTFQMSTASLDSAAMKRSIELLGTEVAPVACAGARRCCATP